MSLVIVEALLVLKRTVYFILFGRNFLGRFTSGLLGTSHCDWKLSDQIWCEKGPQFYPTNERPTGHFSQPIMAYRNMRFFGRIEKSGGLASAPGAEREPIRRREYLRGAVVRSDNLCWELWSAPIMYAGSWAQLRWTMRSWTRSNQRVDTWKIDNGLWNLVTLSKKENTVLAQFIL